MCIKQVSTYSSSCFFAFEASDQILRKRLLAGLGTAAQTQLWALFSASRTGGIMKIQISG